ncbi:MAG TPA: hypothetical protein VKY51_07600 [Fredinandcohnia sp.]|nr:hypothetical protein [Fredinandcohnia sp.]
MGDRAKALGRGAVALAGAALVFLVTHRPAGAGGAADLLPEGLQLPNPSALVPLDGTIAWNGLASEVVVFGAEAEPEAVIATIRAQWEGEPVEWFETETPAGRALIVFDLHRGERWTLLVRRKEDGRTEAIRSRAPLAVPAAATARLPFDLPDALEIVSHLEDRVGGRRVVTAGAVAIDDAKARAICDAARKAGWEGDCTSDDATADGNAVELHRGEERLHLHFAQGPFGQRWLALRWEAE